MKGREIIFVRNEIKIKKGKIHLQQWFALLFIVPSLPCPIKEHLVFPSPIKSLKVSHKTGDLRAFLFTEFCQTLLSDRKGFSFPFLNCVLAWRSFLHDVFVRLSEPKMLLLQSLFNGGLKGRFFFNHHPHCVGQTWTHLMDSSLQQISFCKYEHFQASICFYTQKLCGFQTC